MVASTLNFESCVLLESRFVEKVELIVVVFLLNNPDFLVDFLFPLDSYSVSVLLDSLSTPLTVALKLMSTLLIAIYGIGTIAISGTLITTLRPF